jgi:ABC-type nitrate/sulfonate/bicarbonate transport system permease component
MAPLLAGIVSSLISHNLPKVAQAVIDKGLDKVEEKLGVKLEPDMSAEKIAEVKLAALKHEEFKIEQEFKNIADARAMQVAALQQDDRFSKRFIYFLASFWTIASTLYIGFITFGTIPESNIRFADTILGFILGTVVATILNFFFGSSSGSMRKADTIDKVVQDAIK